MKKLVVFTGAGISQESGLSTFRDSGGMWEQFKIEDVATIKAWETHPERVIEFYNMRRREMRNVEPNSAHFDIAKLQEHFDVQVITQNVDDLHERAGSKNVLHLHGELIKARSQVKPFKETILDGDIYMGDLCENGRQLRPHIVLFGENVPKMEEAMKITYEADIFLVVGTSLVVYPAAGLVECLRPETLRFIVEPNPTVSLLTKDFKYIEAIATVGVRKFVEMIK